MSLTRTLVPPTKSCTDTSLIYMLTFGVLCLSALSRRNYLIYSHCYSGIRCICLYNARVIN